MNTQHVIITKQWKFCCISVLVFTNQKWLPAHRTQKTWFLARSSSIPKGDGHIPDTRLPGGFLLGSNYWAYVKGTQRLPEECTVAFSMVWPSSSLLVPMWSCLPASGEQIHGPMSYPLLPMAISKKHKSSQYHLLSGAYHFPVHLATISPSSIFPE